MKTKTFDCVEMKRRGAALLQEKLKNMTREEQLAFWQQRSEELRKRRQAILQKDRLPQGTGSG